MICILEFLPVRDVISNLDLGICNPKINPTINRFGEPFFSPLTIFSAKPKVMENLRKTRAEALGPNKNTVLWNCPFLSVV